MKATTSDPTRITPAALRALVISSLFAAGSPMLHGADAAPAPAAKAETADKADASLEAAPGEFSNSVTVGVGSFFNSGDDAQFQRRLQRPAGTYGGIEELHYEQAVGKKGSFTLDGRGIFDNHDYGAQVGLSNPSIGYLKAGYDEFRTWYDGSGGYSTSSNRWVSIYNEELFVDRRHAFFEGGLTLPDWPKFTVRYDYESRQGIKDSTVWGDYNLSQNPAVQVLRGITPTWLGIDENRHIFDVDLKHTLGNTDFGIGVRYEKDDIDDSKNIARRIGEPTRVRTVTQSDNTDAQLWNVHAFTETRFNPKVQFNTGYSFTQTDTDIAGSRIYGVTYGSPFASTFPNQQSNDEGFYDLGGGARIDQFVANFNLMLTPWKHITIVPSIRVEHQEQEGDAVFKEFRATNTTSPVAVTDVLNDRVRRFTDVTGALAARYTGLTNWVLYARGEWLQGQGTVREREFDVEDDGTLSPVQLQRSTESDRSVQKYTLGANWYPHKKVNTAVQYYYKVRDNDYDHVSDSTRFAPPTANNLYPAYILENKFNTHDINFRVTLRPLTSLTLVSRYDFTVQDYNMRGDTNQTGLALASVEGGKTTSHILSQSASWTPIQQMYLQGSVSYALQTTESPAADVTGAALNTIGNSENDYWNASATVGFVLSARSDLQAQYLYYRADNFIDNSLVSVPYGAGAEQHGVTATLITRLRKNLIWKLQYGYFTGHDQTYGGNNDYSAHLVYSSCQYLF